jgi:hypothetical protein
VTPEAAGELRDAIGINTRTAFSGTPHADHPNVLAALQYLGIRRIRDAMWPEADQPDQWDFFRQLAALGIKGTINPSRHGQSWEWAELLPNMDAIAADPALVAFVDRFEGANEVDLAYGGSTLDDTLPYMTDMWDKRNNTPALEDIPVVAASFATSGGLDAFAGVLTNVADLGNMHPYPAGSKPAKMWEDGFWMPKFAAVVAAKPLQATEVGYHCEPVGGGHPGVSQTVRAPLTLHLILEHFWRGTSRVDLYTIVEQTDNPNADGVLTTADWGFYDYDWNPHPVAHAVHNFTTIIGDGSPPLTPLDVTVDQAPADLRQLLFRDGDGKYKLCLWRNTELWNVATGLPITVTDQTVTLTIPDANAVREARPVTSATWAPLTLTAGAVTFDLAGDVAVLEIATAADSTAPDTVQPTAAALAVRTTDATLVP